MLNLKFIQENKDTVIRKLAVKNFDAKELVEKIIALDNERKNLQKESDNKQSEMNSISKQIGSLMKEGKKEEAEQARANTTRLKEEIAALTAQHNSTQNELNSLIVRLPNLPHDSVPPGKSDADNVIVKISDNVPAHEEGQLPHWDLAKKYQLIDFEVGVKITGCRIPRLQRVGSPSTKSLDLLLLGRKHQSGLSRSAAPACR